MIVPEKLMTNLFFIILILFQCFIATNKYKMQRVT